MRRIRVVVRGLVSLGLVIGLAAKQAADRGVEQEQGDLDDSRVLVGRCGQLLGLHSFCQYSFFQLDSGGCQASTYVKEILVDVALLILLLEEDVTLGVNDENLAILGNDSLLDTSRRNRGITR